MEITEPDPLGLDDIALAICDVTKAKRSAVVFGERDNSDIHFVAASGQGAERLAGARGPAEGSGLCGNVLAGNCSILAQRAAGDPRVRQDHVVQMAIDTALGVPVHHDGRPFAVLMALNRSDGQPFSPADQQALERYAVQAAPALWEAARRPSAQVRSASEPEESDVDARGSAG